MKTYKCISCKKTFTEGAICKKCLICNSCKSKGIKATDFEVPVVPKKKLLRRMVGWTYKK